MSRRKLRVTGFTRFLLFLVIMVPISYVASSYYQGEDVLANVRSWWKDGKKQPDKSGDMVSASELEACRQELREQKRRLEEALQALEKLEK